ncbi:cytochrome p450 [Moniliophthora roreri MCA 2997]|uniref:Cytochrome p450 n=1 Tax=Moniliophthora roreri (strain MCA 2997) TaxID=1381753 RepID=V2YM90_MONRO|nr:cytochrome p450 [Moniliophthora roreri MCA 2997]
MMFTGTLSFIFSMTCYPEYQIKAQEELDRVVGSKRLLDFTDHDSLPYCKALGLEDGYARDAFLLNQRCSSQLQRSCRFLTSRTHWTRMKTLSR